MSNDAMQVIAQLQAQIEALAAAQGATTSGETVHDGQQFASLGFVAIGSGADPGEGALVNVPTKGGKVVKVRTIQAIDVAPFGVTVPSPGWAYTYKRLKRGES